MRKKSLDGLSFLGIVLVAGIIALVMGLIVGVIPHAIKYQFVPDLIHVIEHQQIVMYGWAIISLISLFNVISSTSKPSTFLGWVRYFFEDVFVVFLTVAFTVGISASYSFFFPQSVVLDDRYASALSTEAVVVGTIQLGLLFIFIMEGYSYLATKVMGEEEVEEQVSM